ncbi:hypothetical protein LZ554_000884 [Drepanopeziza brunnea f. sp. 'monogermtubi']|nr:hypothetical protein LZ554_000884 [Drepanopeziza brunnea f. sp. 'monogermtubi']
MLPSFCTYLALLPLLPLALSSPLLNASPKPTPATSHFAQRDIDLDEIDLNGFLSVLLSKFPALGLPITAATSFIEASSSFIARTSGMTYNHFASAGNSCTAYTVIFARGTAEPGNVGILVGPPFFAALKAQLGPGQFSVQGVNKYSASVEGFLAGGDARGSKEMAAQISDAFLDCPETKLVVAGYSQGGQLVHNALAALPAKVAAWVSKVVLFGAPNDATVTLNIPPDKVWKACHPEDDICDGGMLVMPWHLTYGLDAEDAAAFVVS